MKVKHGTILEDKQMSMKLAKSRESRVLGIASTGWPIFPIFGAEPDDENEETDDSNSSDSGDSDGDSGESSSAEKLAEMVTRAEYDTILKRLQAADKAKGAAEKRLREMDDAEKSELEKAQRDLQVATERAERAEAEALRARMEKELLKYPGYTWHDPDAVLTLVDMDLIDVDEETGKIKGVREALKKLATEKPYLLKGKASEGEKKEDPGAGQKVASGHNPAGNQPDDKNKRRQELMKRYKL